MIMGRQKAKRAEAKSMATNLQKEHAQLKAANEKLKKKVEDLKKELAEERDMRIMAEGEIENTKAALRYKSNCILNRKRTQAAHSQQGSVLL